MSTKTVMVMLHATIHNDDQFSATWLCSIGTMLFLSVTILQQCCKAVWR